jgi:hypothetical protein
VIKGTDVRREGDSYLVTMTGGNTVAFPSALVKEVSLEDDAKPQAPPGYDNRGPRTLAGPTPAEMPSQNPKDQMKVFGPPTQWSKDVVDTTWVPTNAYDPNVDVMAGSRSTWSKSAVDTTWVPKDAYEGRPDVMASSKSTWSQSAVDTTWKPTDGFGFKPLSFKAPAPPPEFASSQSAGTAAAAAARPSGPAPWTCAERFFAKDTDRPTTDKDNRSDSMDVRNVKSPLYAALGLPLYEASGVLGGTPRKAVFTISGGECRLVGGDADALIGMNLPPDHAMAQDAASFNAAMASRGGARVPTGIDKLDYALAFVSLTDPQVSGSSGTALKLIAKPEELRSIAAKAPDACSLSKGKRRKEERTAANAFATPKISGGKEGDVVTFLTWSGAGGTVYRNTVVLARGGVVSAKRDPIASHLGDHKDYSGTFCFFLQFLSQGRCGAPARAKRRTQSKSVGGSVSPGTITVGTLATIALLKDRERRLAQRSIDPFDPGCWKLDGRDRGKAVVAQRVACFGSPRARTRPRPTHRIGGELSAHRIALDVPQNRQQVLVLLNGEGLEPPLPDSADRRMAPAVIVDMRREEPLHPSAQVTVKVGPQDEMKVIRHETPGQHPHRVQLTGPAQQAAEDRQIVRVVKDGLTGVAAGEGVVADVGSYGSGSAAHGSPPKEADGTTTDSSARIRGWAARTRHS